ncbi:MAG: hypothetical protein AAGF57_07125 [Pseudomonadota bacterium]
MQRITVLALMTLFTSAVYAQAIADEGDPMVGLGEAEAGEVMATGANQEMQNTMTEPVLPGEALEMDAMQPEGEALNEDPTTVFAPFGDGR